VNGTISRPIAELTDAKGHTAIFAVENFSGKLLGIPVFRVHFSNNT